jgi:hypothetical protein
MSQALIDTLAIAFTQMAQEVHRDASVLVQFAAGDWAKIKAEVEAATSGLPSAIQQELDVAKAKIADLETQLAAAVAAAEAKPAPVVEKPSTPATPAGSGAAPLA